MNSPAIQHGTTLKRNSDVRRGWRRGMIEVARVFDSQRGQPLVARPVRPMMRLCGAFSFGLGVFGVKIVWGGADQPVSG